MSKSTVAGIGPLLISCVAGLWVFLAVFWVIPAPYTVDDFVYQAAIDAFAQNGGFSVSNGLEAYGPLAPKMAGMRTVEGQLVPQYPSGWTIIAAPAYIIGGIHGVILLNAIASALTLPLVWFTARSLFDDKLLATHAALIWGLATFAVNYALGFWPHSVASFLVTAGLTSIAVGWRGSSRMELLGAATAGLAIGLAITVRVDSILAVGGIVVWQMGVARRPFKALGCFLMGLAPGVGVAALFNHIKFGVLSPVSYGLNEGTSSIPKYEGLLPIIFVVGLAVLALGLRNVRTVVYRPAIQILILAGCAMVILAVPSTRALTVTIVQGLHVLVLDFQALPVSGGLPAGADPHGIIVNDDGTIFMFGLVKKALLQSIPYSAIVILLMPKLAWGKERAQISFLLLFLVPLLVFFALNTFHGGMASNMRYFLSLLPPLAILSALAFREIKVPSGGVPISIAAALFVLATSWYYALAKGYAFHFAFQQTLPNAVIATIAFLSIMVLVTNGRFRALLKNLLSGVAILGLVIATFSAWFFDVLLTRKERAENAWMTELTADLPDDALVVTYSPAKAGYRMNRPPAMTVMANFQTWQVESSLTTLAEDVLASGRPVFIQSSMLAEQMRRRGLRGSSIRRYGIADHLEFYEVK